MWNEIKEINSTDNNVKKFVFTKDNAVAESVLYKYPTYDERTVICCSTMSGCPVGCRFCGAGDNFVRSLTAEEIVSQPVHLLKQTGVDPKSIKKPEDMPEYLRIKNKVLRVVKYNLTFGEFLPEKSKYMKRLEYTQPATEQEYLDYIKQKEG
jgi:adenine C2-methylase RlmN of 23S rRNA A2503 and tRNA A37